MTENDLQQIEKHLGFTVPPYYRATLLNYLFDSGSFADEFMLPTRAQEVIELNDAEFSSSSIGQPFFIGSDGGEEWYFVDASESDSGVFVFELETGKHRALTSTWVAYLDHIRTVHAEVAADEHALLERKKNKKWWQFWI